MFSIYVRSTSVRPWRSTQAPSPASGFVGSNKARYPSPELDDAVDRYLVAIPIAERMIALSDIIYYQTENLSNLPLFYEGSVTLLGARRVKDISSARSSMHTSGPLRSAFAVHRQCWCDGASCWVAVPKLLHLAGSRGVAQICRLASPSCRADAVEEAHRLAEKESAVSKGLTIASLLAGLGIGLGGGLVPGWSTGSSLAFQGGGERTATAPESAPATAPSGQPEEGVKVQGSWTIEVQDPDGSTVSSIEFENALQPTGRDALNNLLRRQNTFGRWQVVLSSGTSLPCLNVATPVICRLAEPDDASVTGPTNFKNLTVSVPTSGTNANKLVLQGTATAQRDGNVSVVSSK